MRCPACDEGLRSALTRQGVEVDLCDQCGGVWLDGGEILLLARQPKAVEQRLEAARAGGEASVRRSPRSGQPMLSVRYAGGPRIDLCEQTGGIWCDPGELKALLAAEPEVRLEVDPGSKAGAAARAAAATALPPLPNLFLRSTMTLVGLYAVLGLVLVAAVAFAGVPPGAAVLAGVVVIGLQFLLGPFIMDLTLRWLYRARWVSRDELPEHLRAFVIKVAREHRMGFPRFAVIDDGAPQAFTYGHTPRNARIVISRGLLELLEPEEAEAVVAHEMGHAVHWDMALMTAAQLVPLLLYYVYQTLMRLGRSSSGSNRKGGGAPILVAVGAYLLYLVSQYVVLWFSRTREYHADRFAGRVTGAPARLASALVKIAYGLAGQERAGKEDEKKAARSPRLEAIGALGIFDAGTARSLAIASYGEGAGGIVRDNLEGAMRWDMWNPWARWYELNSTHPLVAKRLLHLSAQARHMGGEPYVTFDAAQPESYWDEFLTDIGVHFLPHAAILVAPLAYALAALGSGILNVNGILAATLTALGAALLVRFHFSYRGGYFPQLTVAALLKRVKVSAVRPVPCRLRGTLIGRGMPGYIFSEDFVLKDPTGIIFLDYRQPLAIWEMLFGLLRAGRYQGREVMVEGWYRRAPVPYVEIKRMVCDGEERRSWVPVLYRASALALLVAGILVGIAAPFEPAAVGG